MEPLAVNLETPNPVSGFYRWEVPDKSIVVDLDYRVVDRLLMEVMRGFGAIPRRGAEVGGVLLGTVETGDRTIVKIEDYDPVASEHKRGPSYLLSESDTARFTETVQKWAPGPDKRIYAVGCYRSHTREGLGLADEDLTLFNEFFPELSNVFLLIKPFATRAGAAGFFFREDGAVVRKESPYLEFPFRRRELGGGSDPSRIRTMPGPGHAPYPRLTTAVPLADDMGMGGDIYTGDQTSVDDAVSQVTADFRVPRTIRSPRNFWIPLAFIFFLLGVVIGFQSALMYRGGTSASASSDPFRISLSVAKENAHLHIRWDRGSRPIRDAKRAVLTILDGPYKTDVKLDASQLQNPSMFYKLTSDEVELRMEVFFSDNSTLAETAVWKKAK